MERFAKISNKHTFQSLPSQLSFISGNRTFLYFLKWNFLAPSLKKLLIHQEVTCKTWKSNKKICSEDISWGVCVKRKRFAIVLFFFLRLCQPYPEYRGSWSKKLFYRPSNSYRIQLFVPIKRKFFGFSLFQNKLQRRGIPQRLLDK